MKKYRFEIRQVDAWGNEFGGYDYNETFHIATVESSAKNERRLFTRALARHGIVFRKNRTLIQYDGSIYELIDRKTKAPIFCMLPVSD